MATEGVDLPAGGGVPELHRGVLASRGEGAAVGAERHAPDEGRVAAQAVDARRTTEAIEIVPLEAAKIRILSPFRLQHVQMILHHVGPAVLPGLLGELDLRQVQLAVADQLLISGSPRFLISTPGLRLRLGRVPSGPDGEIGRDQRAQDHRQRDADDQAGHQSGCGGTTARPAPPAPIRRATDRLAGLEPPQVLGQRRGRRTAGRVLLQALQADGLDVARQAAAPVARAAPARPP